MIGLIVKSKKGRDSGKYYIIGKDLDPFHVALIDGQKFDFKRQKRKNKKHLCIITRADDEIVQGIIHQEEKCLKNIIRLLELEAKEV
jgi:ribosomal protein L14E/L6E/L27E